MEVRFRGGPWDGVTIETEIAPEHLEFRHLLWGACDGEPYVDESGDIVMEMPPTQVRTHHVYLLDYEAGPGGNPDDSRPFYRYAPGKKQWWDHQARVAK
jgi:hypothetical protein